MKLAWNDAKAKNEKNAILKLFLLHTQKRVHLQTQEQQRTTLYKQHEALKAKIAPFNGWDMPVRYESVISEHKHVREHVGLFDVSHMGEIFIKGSNAAKLVSKLVVGHTNKLEPGQGLYTLMCNQSGGVVDDLILYRIDEQSFLLCVNAGNIAKDFEWIQRINNEHRINADVENQSPKWAQIAVQGPKSLLCCLEVLDEHDQQKLKELSYTHIFRTSHPDFECYIARTGYTGEWGYEIYVDAKAAEKLWSELLNSTLKPKAIGLGARDTLRLEACYPLYGNEMNDQVSPFAAGVGWTVKLDKEDDFIGKSSLIDIKNKGSEKVLHAFKLLDPGVPRQNMLIYRNNELIGKVTSGSTLPSVGGTGGLAHLNRGSAKTGDKVSIDIRGKRKEAIIVKKPIYSAKTK